MNEAQTRQHLIDPALKALGWLPDLNAEFHYEPEIVTPGRIGADGKHGRPKRADYVLYHNKKKLAVIEAKKAGDDVTKGEVQARFYPEALGLRIGIATNGTKMQLYDLKYSTTRYGDIKEIPTPAQLLALLADDKKNELEEACEAKPYSRKFGGREPRYYQERAVEAVIRRIGENKGRALLTLATGTGKTFIAYQLMHKLTEVKWNLKGLGKDAPRILFITDRNILADQALEDFPFKDGYVFRYEAGVKLPLDRNIYVTLFQTLMGDDGRDTKYKQFGANFFDLVIIDECHRGGSNDESQWRKILDYFKDAVHVGLTATPKCDVNGNTYIYFGKPAYVYSLKQGIEDGFLTQYRVERCKSTLEKYQIDDGDIIKLDGEITEDDEKLPIKHDKDYDGNQIERKKVLIRERDEHFVDELFKRMPLDQKAIVFCVTQRHAHRIAQLIREQAAKLGHTDPHYCETITADTGSEGETQLRIFRKTENTIPTILTTSVKLSTGVDAANIRSIVLFRNVGSMVEFKQIIGRGTRICEGKGYFTIYDFTGATDKFQDPAWDGDVVCPKCGQNPCVCKKGGEGGGGEGHKPCPKCGKWPCECLCPKCGQYPCICPPEHQGEVEIKLSPTRTIKAEWEEYVYLDGEQIKTQDFILKLVEAVKSAKSDPEDLRDVWSNPESREEFLETMSAAGFDEEGLKMAQRMLNLGNYDLFDVLMDLAYNETPVTRELRAQRARAAVAKENPSLRKFAEKLLANYVNDGVWTLTENALKNMVMMDYHSLTGGIQSLGFSSATGLRSFYTNLQTNLYADFSNWRGRSDPSRQFDLAKLRILTDIGEELKYRSYLPVYSLRAACGPLADGETVEPEGWVNAEGHGQLDETQFVVRTEGVSMEGLIPEGSYAIFRKLGGGNLAGKTLLIQRNDASDPEDGGAYTVKRFTRQGAQVALKAKNPKYDITLRDEAESSTTYRALAEFKELL